MANFVCGANQDDTHYASFNWGRDCIEPTVADIRKVIAGDPSPDHQGHLLLTRGIEVGHVFQLGDKYSQAMQATVLDETGKSRVLSMGCYGIGVSRIVAAAIEQNYDEKGIIWPQSMAPFEAVLIPIGFRQSTEVKEATEKLYCSLEQAGIEILLDDRDERPGIMFNDAELIGIPHRLVVGEKGLKAGTIEYKSRQTGQTENIPFDQILRFLETQGTT
jgi:prolyl-tRNA synthetase